MIREKLTERRRKIREARNRKLLYSLFLCFVISVASFGLYVGFNFNFADNQKIFTDKSEKNSPNTILPTLQKPTTIMLMGVDERKDDVGRSDTLMILNLSENRASLLTIPRDTLVYVNRCGYQKINAAYMLGGEKLTQRTVEDFLGMKIDNYVKVNTKEFAKIIDAVGGIDIEVEKSMHYEDPWDDNGGLVIDLKEGLQHLDGETAIQFVRFRDSEGDIGRIRRQQKFMRACTERLSDPTMLVKLPEFFSAAANAVETDLTSAEMLAVAGSLKLAKSEGKIKTGVVPGYLQYIDNVSYLIPAPKRLCKVLTKNLGMDADKKHFDKLEGEYTPGNPADFYDVNVNFDKDLRIMDDLKYIEVDLSANDL